MRRSLLLFLAACGGPGTDTARVQVFADYREPCDDRTELKQVLWGDLHVHTEHSFDALVFDVRTSPADAYRFARGEALDLPPLGPDGAGTQAVKLRRPLDFAAVTDHAEYLGEVAACKDPASTAYDTSSCVEYREATDSAIYNFGLGLTRTPPERMLDVCAATDCLEGARDVWGRIQDAAEEAYDRTSACSFTSFVAYEYSGATSISNLHRNIVFRNGDVPAQPATWFEYPTAYELFARLDADCLSAGGRCDVLSIPHNSNWSNGNLFNPEYPGASTVSEQAALAAQRVAMEPLVEVIQHKGDSECVSGLSGVIGVEDELCDFEKLRQPPNVADCGDTPGSGAMAGLGCLSRLDFIRGALLEGLLEEQRLGVNPYRLGLIASTDTHNGTPGLVDEDAYPGHWGNNEDTPEGRLDYGGVTPGGVLNNPGGLAAVWAEENTRDAIFDALRRRETYATSGPRIPVRVFGGWDLPADLCEQPDFVEQGYALGVPMGGELEPASGTPTFAISALRDTGEVSAPLERLQLVKGWIEDGQAHEAVLDVAGTAGTGAVDLDSCEVTGTGADSLCTVWSDPDFDPTEPAFYYVRVVETPTCRWSWRQCLSLPEDERPESCSDDAIPRTVQERAWTSPIWYSPS